MTSGFPWTPLLLDLCHPVLEDTLRPMTQTLNPSSYTVAWGRLSATTSCTSSTLWPGIGSLSLWVCCQLLTCCSDKYSNRGKGNALLWFVFAVFRREEMFQIWHTILQPFIRRSFLSLVELSRAIPLEINPAVMLCTSLTQSLNSGTSRSWRGTDLCLGLGQSSFKKQKKTKTTANFVSSKYCYFFSKILIPCLCLYGTGTRPHWCHRSWSYLVDGRPLPTLMISTF